MKLYKDLSFEIQLDIFGYEEMENRDSLTNNYSFLIDRIKECNLEQFIIEPNLRFYNFLKLKRKTLNNSKFLLQSMDLNIPYISRKDFEILIWHSNSTEDIKKHLKQQNIFKIPIQRAEFPEVHYLYSIFVNHISLPPLVDYISLSKIFSDIYYFHEIGHMLVGKKGYIKNYLHTEVIPILFELIYTYENYSKEKLCQIIVERLNNLQKSFMTLQWETYERDVYFVSTLKAFYIFSFYEKNATFIIDSISKIVNGIITVEEFLNYFDCSFANDELLKKNMELLESVSLTKKRK